MPAPWRKPGDPALFRAIERLWDFGQAVDAAPVSSGRLQAAVDRGDEPDPVSWQLQEAKQRLSEVVRRAVEDGPQVVTRHGKGAVVVISIEEFERLKQVRPDFKEFLRSAPDLGRLRITRDRKAARKVTL